MKTLKEMNELERSGELTRMVDEIVRGDMTYTEVTELGGLVGNIAKEEDEKERERRMTMMAGVLAYLECTGKITFSMTVKVLDLIEELSGEQ